MGNRKRGASGPFISFHLASRSSDVRCLIETIRASAGRKHFDRIWAKHSTPGRLDSPDTAFLKRALQTALPDPLRSQLVDQLFRAHVTEDEAGFARELYLSASDLHQMA